MPIRIDWIDPNGEGVPVKIHRSLTPMLDEANLPAPIATVTGASFYLDQTVERNKLYYYRLSSLGKAGSNETIITPNKVMAYMPYTGPGPQTLLRGDWECGYFGRMAMADLVAASELMGFGGFTTAVEYVPTPPNEWVKLVLKGKIIFTPLFPICGTIAWKTVYDAGLVYGDIPESEWTAYAKTTFGVVEQKKRIQIGDDLFVIRNPTSRADPLNTGSNTEDMMGGEWDQILALLGRTRIYLDVNGRGQFDDSAYPDFSSMTTNLLGNGIMIRRGRSGAGLGIDSVVTAGANPIVASSGNGWKPMLILEL